MWMFGLPLDPLYLVMSRPRVLYWAHISSTLLQSVSQNDCPPRLTGANTHFEDGVKTDVQVVVEEPAAEQLITPPLVQAPNVPVGQEAPTLKPSLSSCCASQFESTPSPHSSVDPGLRDALPSSQSDTSAATWLHSVRRRHPAGAAPGLPGGQYDWVTERTQ
jgi:hypothetical protein